MRIVSGKYKNKNLIAPKGQNTRPTTDKVRAALFNILSHATWHTSENTLLDDAFILDLFAGTGALGFEALSRGGKDLITIENHLEACQALNQNIKNLGCSDVCQHFKWDATRPRQRPATISRRTLVFIDPPYRQDLGGKALQAFADKDWLAEGAVCIVEAAKSAPEAIPENLFEQLDHRKYGDTTLTIYRYFGA